MDAKKKLLIAFAFNAAANPIASFLQNVYIWRSLNDMTYIIWFNIGGYLVIPLGFYWNGKLLNRVKNTKLFLIGGVLMGVSNLLLILFTIQNQLQIFLLGVGYGLGMSFYWANRNNITYEFTHDHNRNWFFASASVLKSTVGIIVPILVGALITLLDVSYHVPINLIYLGFAIVYLLLTVLGPLFIYFEQQFNYQVKFTHAKVTNSFFWKSVAVNTMQFGFFNALNSIVVPLLVITMVGKEFALGSLQTSATVVTIVIMFFFSRYLKTHHRLQVYIIGVVLLIAAAILNFILLNQFSVVVYIGLAALTLELILVSTEPVTLKVIELESAKYKVDAAVYIFEREKYYMIGRIIALLLMLGFYLYGGNEFTFRLVMFIVIISQLPGIFIWARLSKHLRIL